MNQTCFVFGIIVMLFLISVSGCVREDDKTVYDIFLPSASAGVDGSLAVRIISPLQDMERYDEGAPVIIFLPGGYEVKGVDTDFPESADDIIIVSFV
ncbi:MAG: hypothetical protein KGY50_05245, partial [Candidatus Thermoplasmatota archaeon]|nr:hypothetical protein [Candidatus Thermoplasmatota archaeon]